MVNAIVKTFKDMLEVEDLDFKKIYEYVPEKVPNDILDEDLKELFLGYINGVYVRLNMDRLSSNKKFHKITLSKILDLILTRDIKVFQDHVMIYLNSLDNNKIFDRHENFKNITNFGILNKIFYYLQDSTGEVRKQLDEILMKILMKITIKETPEFSKIEYIRSYKIPNSFYFNTEIFLHAYNIWLYWEQHHPIKFNVFVSKQYMRILDTMVTPGMSIEISGSIHEKVRSIIHFMSRPGYQFKWKHKNLTAIQQSHIELLLSDTVDSLVVLNYKTIVDNFILEDGEEFEKQKKTMLKQRKKDAKKNRQSNDKNILLILEDLKVSDTYLHYETSLLYIYDIMLDSNLRHVYEFLKENIFQKYDLNDHWKKEYRVLKIDDFVDILILYPFVLSMNDLVIKWMFMNNSTEQDLIYKSHYKKFEQMYDIITQKQIAQCLYYIFENLALGIISYNNKIVEIVLRSIFPKLDIFPKVRAGDDYYLSHMFYLFLSCIYSNNDKAYTMLLNILKQQHIDFFVKYHDASRIFIKVIRQLRLEKFIPHSDTTMINKIKVEVQRGVEGLTEIDERVSDLVRKYKELITNIFEVSQQEAERLEYKQNLTSTEMKKMKNQYEIFKAFTGPYDEIYATSSKYYNVGVS
jgi:hypothetical protein